MGVCAGGCVCVCVCQEDAILGCNRNNVKSKYPNYGEGGQADYNIKHIKLLSHIKDTHTHACCCV